MNSCTNLFKSYNPDQIYTREVRARKKASLKISGYVGGGGAQNKTSRVYIRAQETPNDDVVDELTRRGVLVDLVFQPRRGCCSCCYSRGKGKFWQIRFVNSSRLSIPAVFARARVVGRIFEITPYYRERIRAIHRREI